MIAKDKLFADREKWQQIFEDWGKSGLSARSYCMNKKIEIHKFYKWQHRFFKDSKKMDLQKEWQQVFEDWEKSGLNPKAYCQEKKILIYTFYKWRTKLNFTVSKDLKDRAVREKWKKICEEWEASSLSPRQYCKEKKIQIRTFYRWSRKIEFPIVPQFEKITENWEGILKDWKDSGLSQRSYCKEKKIPLWTFYRRRNKLELSTEIHFPKIVNKWKKIIKNWEKSGLKLHPYCRTILCISPMGKKPKISISKMKSIEKLPKSGRKFWKIGKKVLRESLFNAKEKEFYQ